MTDELDDFLDKHPCKHCGAHYNDHDYLTRKDIADARRAGWVVDVCEPVAHNIRLLSGDHPEGRTSFCRLIQPIKNPCDGDFMKAISS
jgi:hypothetical protein